MSDLESENSASRDELLQRVALMETMIAEGRRSTARYGWIFVLWGVVDLAGMGWQYKQPDSGWVWPVVISAGMALMLLGKSMQKPEVTESKTIKSRSIAAVWSMMGLCVCLYCFAAIFRHDTAQVSYLAAVLMMVGLAHAISAMILRWRVQGLVAVLWWASGIAVFFTHNGDFLYTIVITDMVAGMILFGLYAMMLERHREASMIAHRV